MRQYGRMPTNAAIRRMAAMAPRIPHRRGRGRVGTSFTLRIAAMSDRSPRWENVFGPRGLPAGEGSRDSGGEGLQDQRTACLWREPTTWTTTGTPSTSHGI